MAPTDAADGVDDPEWRILVADRAARNVPLVVLHRCAQAVIKRRPRMPVNDSWEESPVLDIDGQSVIMTLSVEKEEGRRALLVKRARYKQKKGGERVGSFKA
jgi:hypothetical protein